PRYRPSSAGPGSKPNWAWRGWRSSPGGLMPRRSSACRCRFPPEPVGPACPCKAGPGRHLAAGAGRAAEPLKQADGHHVAGLLADELADLALHRELVRAVTQGHEGAPERVAVDGAAHLDQAA